MEFGKVDSATLDQIDLSLPPDDPRTWVRLKKSHERHREQAAAQNTPHFYVGCPVWGVKEWVERLKTWIHLGIEEVHFFIHQPDNAAAPELVSRFIDRINQECGLGLPKWKPMTENPNEPTQLGFF